jgi:hypothetical protein
LQCVGIVRYGLSYRDVEESVYLWTKADVPHGNFYLLDRSRARRYAQLLEELQPIENKLRRDDQVSRDFVVF